MGDAGVEQLVPQPLSGLGALLIWCNTHPLVSSWLRQDHSQYPGAGLRGHSIAKGFASLTTQR